MRTEYEPAPNPDGKAHVGEVWETTDSRLLFRVVAERIDNWRVAVVDIVWIGSNERDTVPADLWAKAMFYRLLYREIPTTRLLFVGGSLNGKVTEVDGGAPPTYVRPVQDGSLIRFWSSERDGTTEQPSYACEEYRLKREPVGDNIAVMRFTR